MFPISYSPLSQDQDQSAIGLAELAYIHTNLLTVNNLLSSGYSSDAASPNANLPVETERRPWLDPPEGYIPIDEQNGGDIVNPPSTTFTIYLTFTVDEGFDGVINGLNFNVVGGGFVDFSGDLIAQVTRNGAPIRGYDNIRNQKGTPATPREISPIRIYSKQVIAFQVQHPQNAALTGSIIVGLRGFLYPSKG